MKRALILSCLVLLLPYYCFCQHYIELYHYQAPDLTISELGDVTIQYGESIAIGGSTIVIGGTEPYTYLWDPATGLSDPGIPDPVASPEDTTVYTLTVIDGNNCLYIAKQTVNVLQSSGIFSHEEDRMINIFPNPSDGIFTLEINSNDIIHELSYSILNITGQLIFKEDFDPNSTSLTYRIDLKSQPAGSYIMKLQLNQDLFLHNILIK
ncbi:T9SS type A sorting domain-containing protein [Bacteroidota bacterium]